MICLHLVIDAVPTPYPGYYATTDGRIWSASGWRSYGWREMTQAPNGKDYLRVRLVIDGKRKSMAVHTIICRTFHGERPTPGHWVRHIDGNNLHNEASNLAWGTPLENSADTVLHGHSPKGIRNNHAIMTENKVSELRRLVGAGMTHREAAERFGISKATASDIIYRTWQHVVNA